MTEEQIYKAAKEWATKHLGAMQSRQDMDDIAMVFSAGAHSRDREVMDLEHLLKVERTSNKVLIEANEKLRNPWISVEERLPEKLENDCASYYVLTRMDGPRQIWYMVNRYNYDIKSLEGCNNNTTHWMPIPQIKKGE